MPARAVLAADAGELEDDERSTPSQRPRGATPARSGDARGRLKAVLEAYAMISYRRQQGGTGLAALLHRGDQVASAQQRSSSSSVTCSPTPLRAGS